MVTKEELREILLKPKEVEIVKALEIRDILTHESDVVDLSLYNVQTVYVLSDLDQSITVQIKGNWTATKTHSVNIGSSYSVAAGDSEGKTLTPDSTGWLPFVYVTLKCSTAPTTGNVWVRILAKPI